MAKRKPLTRTQVENLKDLIFKIERPVKLEELLIDVQAHLNKEPPYQSWDFSVTSEVLLKRFVDIMTEKI